MKPLVCLCMIVKNEAHVIERCLRSCLAVGIDYWVIADTGSTDGTQDKIRQILADVPGELHEDAWVSFPHNRTLVSRRARGKAVWLLWIDADGTFEGTTRTLPPFPPVDAFAIHLTISNSRFVMYRILRGDKDWPFENELHEHVCMTEETTRSFWPELRDVSYPDGARSKNPEKWLLDAQKLETMPRTTRTVFHLAQSYREAGDIEKARAAYLERAGMDGGLPEERWQAKFYAARMGFDLGLDVWTEYIAAYSERPWRIEPLVDLARMCSQRQWDGFAYLLMRTAIEMAEPKREMFGVEMDKWRWIALEEYAIAAAHIGRLGDASWALEEVLKREPPPEIVERCSATLRKVEEHAREIQVSKPPV